MSIASTLITGNFIREKSSTCTIRFLYVCCISVISKKIDHKKMTRPIFNYLTRFKGLGDHFFFRFTEIQCKHM